MENLKENNLLKKNIISLLQLFVALCMYVFVHLNTDFKIGWSYLSIGLLIFTYYMIATFQKDELKMYRSTPYIVGSIVFGFFYILGREYLWNDVFFETLRVVNIPILIIQWLLLAFLFYEFLICIHRPKKQKHKQDNYFMKKLKEQSIWKLFLFILCCWIPYMILMYPAQLNADSLFELAEFWGISNSQSMSVILRDPTQLITSHHPVLYTYLIGCFSKFININVGLYLYNILQTLCVIYCISKLLLFVNQRIENNRVLSYILIAICFYPFIPFLFISLEKDVLFACVFIFFGMSLYEWIFENKLNKKSFILSSIFLVLLRNNVKYVFFLFLILLFLTLKDYRKQILLTTVIIICTLFAQSAFCNLMHITPGSKVEMLSVPLQQTARYVTNYGDDVTEHEKEVISKILDYKKIPKKYKPRISDPIKEMFTDKKPSEAELSEYFKVWFQMFFKHPMCYIESVINMQIETFYPNGICVSTVRRSYETKYMLTNITYLEDYLIDTTDFGFKPNHMIDQIGVIVDKIMYLANNLPIVGLITMSATYVWFAIIIFLDSIKQKKWKQTLLFLSFYILYLGTLFLGPCDAVFEFRYIYPFFVSVPLFYLIQKKNQQS